MKKIILTSLFLIVLSATKITAQDVNTKEVIAGEKYGKTLNGGVGIGYYGYIGHAMPVLHANFEFDVAKNLTLAPFITYYSYQNNYYWGNPKYPYRDYSYRQTVIPVGVKGTYYFDQLLKAGSKWDFYLGASLGFAIRKTTWENGYYGETTVQHGSSGLYFDGHIGTEYHLNSKAGLFLDLSSSISTFGLAIHF
jgi:hypothetical protein